jgi:hypothetical protein
MEKTLSKKEIDALVHHLDNDKKPKVKPLIWVQACLEVKLNGSWTWDVVRKITKDMLDDAMLHPKYAIGEKTDKNGPRNVGEVHKFIKHCLPDYIANVLLDNLWDCEEACEWKRKAVRSLIKKGKLLI